MQGRPGGALQREEVAGVAPGRLPCGPAGQNRPAPRAWHQARRGPGRSCDPRHCGADGFIAGKHSLAGAREPRRRRGPTLAPEHPLASRGDQAGRPLLVCFVCLLLV